MSMFLKVIFSKIRIAYIFKIRISRTTIRLTLKATYTKINNDVRICSEETHTRSSYPQTHTFTNIVTPFQAADIYLQMARLCGDIDCSHSYYTAIDPPCSYLEFLTAAKILQAEVSYSLAIDGPAHLN